MSTAVPFLIAALGTGQPADPAGVGYLYEPAYVLDYALRGSPRPYAPQPGDIYLASEDWFIARAGHLLVHSGAPQHSGIVFALPDGRPALLEGGPDNTRFIRVLDLGPQIAHYAETKRVWIRRRCAPLTPEQSRRLTAFALTAANRPFASVRMVMENSALRSKGFFRSRFVGKPHAATFDPDVPGSGMRARYYCSELVSEACVAAGLFDPVTTRPPSIYPRELFFGSSRIPYVRRHLDMGGWEPPARWVAEPGYGPRTRARPFIDGDTGSLRRGP
jgi:hypothetical protein